MSHIRILPPDPCTVRVRQRWIHGLVGFSPILTSSIGAKLSVAWFIWPHYPFPILRCPVSSFPTPMQMNFCVMGRNEWCSHRHSTMHSYPPQFSAHGSSWNPLGRALVDNLCLLNYSKVPVLTYNSSEMMPITLLENCVQTFSNRDLSFFPFYFIHHKKRSYTLLILTL